MEELNGKDLLGRPVKIKPGVPKSTRGGSEGWIDFRIRKEGIRTPRAFERWERNDAAEHWRAPSEQGRRLYIGGLPRMLNQGAVEAEIHRLFRGFTMYVLQIRWHRGRCGGVWSFVTNFQPLAAP